MKKLLFLIWALSVSLQIVAEIRVVDDFGDELVLSSPALRIVSLAPHITELIYAAGAGEQLVGVVSYSDYPEAAKSIQLIGSYNKVSFENIVAVRPDLILAWGSGNGLETIDRLKSLGLKVHVNEPRRLEDDAEIIRQYGLLSGNENIANQAATNFLNSYQELLETA